MHAGEAKCCILYISRINIKIVDRVEEVERYKSIRSFSVSIFYWTKRKSCFSNYAKRQCAVVRVLQKSINVWRMRMTISFNIHWPIRLWNWCEWRLQICNRLCGGENFFICQTTIQKKMMRARWKTRSIFQIREEKKYVISGGIPSCRS